MKDHLIIISSGSPYSNSVVQQRREVSSLRLGPRQLTFPEPAGRCQALMAGFIFTLNQPDAQIISIILMGRFVKR